MIITYLERLCVFVWLTPTKRTPKKKNVWFHFDVVLVFHGVLISEKRRAAFLRSRLSCEFEVKQRNKRHTLPYHYDTV